jgi:hypothetical protein
MRGRLVVGLVAIVLASVAGFAWHDEDEDD